MGEGFDQLLQGVRDMGAGGAIVFAILWWFERSDRKGLQARLDAKSDKDIEEREKLLRETISATNTVAGGLKENAVGVQQVQQSLGSIAEIVRQLAARIK